MTKKNFKSRKKHSAFTLIESLIFLTLFCLAIVGIYFVTQISHTSDVKSLVVQIAKYNNAITTFTDKYNALPGDAKNTVSFGITENNTDGNGDDIVTDRNQKIISASGEITNFWLHLSKTKLIGENFDGAENEKAKIGSTFPISKVGDKIGIVVFGDEGKTFFQIGFKFSNHDRLFTSNRSLKTFESYSFDEKIDDGNPKKGRVIAVGENHLNATSNDECVKFSEYNQTNDQPVCQLRIEIK